MVTSSFRMQTNYGLSANVKIAVPFMAGLFIGTIFPKLSTPPLGPAHGMVIRLEDKPARNTSHVDDNGRPITKQQLLEPFIVPNFVGYSVATFLPGQTMMPVHEHETMHEFFYVIEGSGVIQVDNVDHKVAAGTFLHIAPHEKHGIWIPDDKSESMKMAVCGVTV